MKIGGKIYSLVGMLGFAAVVIGVMGIYVTAQYAGRADALRTVSERVYLGEHMNRTVTAVVMEARGIYAAPTTEKAASFAKGLIKNLDEIDGVIAAWKPLVPAEQQASFDSMVGKAAEFRAFRTETARLGTEVDPKAANEQGNNEANRANRKAFQADIDAVVEQDKAELQQITASLKSFQTLMLMLIAGVTFVAVAGGAGFGLYIAVNQLSRPIRNVTSAMKKISDGETPPTRNDIDTNGSDAVNNSTTNATADVSFPRMTSTGRSGVVTRNS